MLTSYTTPRSNISVGKGFSLEVELLDGAHLPLIRYNTLTIITRPRAINVGVNEVLQDPHSIDSPEPCVKLIAESGAFPKFTFQPLLFDFPEYGVVACQCCVKLLSKNPYDYSHSWYFNTLEDIVYHIRTMYVAAINFSRCPF